jgi:hypothetical protein
MNILVVGYYNHCNLGDEQYKLSIKYIFNNLPYVKPKSVEFLDCDKLNDYLVPENTIIVLGGGDVLNTYFLDKINKKFIDMPNRPKIIAFSVGIPYNSIFLQPENLKKLEIFDHIYLRTRQDIPIFSQFFDKDRVSYLPDASCYLPDACATPVPPSYFTSLSKPRPTPSTNDMYKKLYSALYSLHKTKKIINVNLCRHIYHPQYRSNYDAIVRELARFLEDLTKRGYYLVLLPFNTKEVKDEETNCENDILIHNDVLRHIKNHANILNIDYELSIPETLSLYSFFYMSVPMRFHGTLFSIHAAVPMVPIFTTKKIRNILLDIGWKYEYVFEKNEKDLPLSFNSKKMIMTFLNCVRQHTRCKILLKTQYENFKANYKAEYESIKNKLLSPVRVTNKMIVDIIPPPPEKDLYDTYFSPLNAPSKSDIIKFSNNPIYSQKENKVDGELIQMVFEKLQTFAQEHGFQDFREITDPTLKNVAACVVSYFLTGNIDSQYHHGMMEKMFINGYEYEKEWKWVLQHYIANGKTKPPLPENPNGPFNIGYIDQNDQSGAHRSGWAHVFENLAQYNNSSAPIMLDLYVDRTFHWKREIFKQIGVIPYKQPWIGFIHHTFDETFSEYNNKVLLDCPEFLESLRTCQGIIVLSRYLQRYFEDELEVRNIKVPVYFLVHPTETNVPKFNTEAFFNNPDKKLIHIGGWLRNIFSFYQLELDPRIILKKSDMVEPITHRCFINLRNVLRMDRSNVKHCIRKVALKGKYMENYYPPKKLGENMTNALKMILDNNKSETTMVVSTSKGEPMFCSQANLQNNWLKHMIEYLNSIEKKMDIMSALDNKAYDDLLTNNIVFLNLVDGSAVNTIIECVVRNTPVFVNRHPAVVDILGRNYPLYYSDVKDINRLLENPTCIKNGYEYMKKMDKTPYKIKTFVQMLLQILSV